MPKPIYVEIEIAAPLEELWARTQTPEVHARWDLRFSEIRYKNYAYVDRFGRETVTWIRAFGSVASGASTRR